MCAYLSLFENNNNLYAHQQRNVSNSINSLSLLISIGQLSEIKH